MKKIMLINAVDEELSRMAVLESGKLVEYNIQMSRPASRSRETSTRASC